jgi:hypothetical protein
MATAEVRPVAATGQGRGLVVVPSPSCENPFAPQPTTRPSTRRASVKPSPTLIAVAPVTPPVATGCSRIVVVPSASSRPALRPHAKTDPSLRSATVCEPPPETLGAVRCPVTLYAALAAPLLV